MYGVAENRPYELGLKGENRIFQSNSGFGRSSISIFST